MNNNAIITQELTRDFATVRAVDRLTIQVPAGIIFGFLGPNGSGKTTTIRLLLGLLEPNQGKAQVLGFDAYQQASEVRARCGALLENSGLYERLNAEDNLDFYGKVWHIPTAERKARVRELLTNLDLWDRRKEIVGKWSRGMKQKLAIARALFHRPALVFMDEPTAGLDPVAAATLHEDLAALVEQEGVTVFLTTHNLPEAEKLCQQVGVIRQGKLLAVGSPEQLRSQAGGARMGGARLEVTGRGFTPEVISQLRLRGEVTSADLRTDQLIIHMRNNSDSAGLISFLVNQGVQVEEACRSKASLEEAFLSLMEEE
jgi:ABC-2 type transport system ATP-binding protein